MKAAWRTWHIAGLTLVVGACSPRTTEPGPQPPQTTVHTPPAATFELCRAGLPERGNFKCDPAFGDVNGDGRLDLAAHPRLGGGPQVWLGNADGQWRSASEGLAFGETCCGGGVCFGDVNLDGRLDLAVADHCQGLFVYLGNGAGRWEMVTRNLYPSESIAENESPDRYKGAEDVALGDVNGDGWLDLVAGASDTGGISIYFGDGTGRNWTENVSGLGTPRWVTRVLLVDVDQNDTLDLVASCNVGPRVWLGDGQGGWQSVSEGLPAPIFKGLYNGIAVGDVNEDGRRDVAAANWVDGPEVYLRQADQSWQQTPDVFPDLLGGSYGLALGDVDRDGHLDMIVSGRIPAREVGYVYGVFLLRGDGRGGWTYVSGSGLPESGLPFTWGIALGDVDGDGVLDVAAGSGGTVATNPEYAQPLIPAGVLAWRTRLPVP